MGSREPNESSIFIGIDPGANGCIDSIDFSGCIVYHTRIPDAPRDLLATLTDLIGDNCAGIIVEKVGVRPYNSRRSCWTFGYSTGQLHACLDILEQEYQLVTPLAWMREMECLTGGDKRISRDRAKELFDGNITHQSADGILIAEFSRRYFTGSLENG